MSGGIDLGSVPTLVPAHVHMFRFAFFPTLASKLSGSGSDSSEIAL